MRVNPTNINKSTPLSLVHPGFNRFFKWINGKLEPKDKNNPTLFEKTNGLVLNTTKTIWSLYLPLQIIGLFSERAGKLAKAFYGVCWSIVYTCYRPWKENREKLPEVDDKGKEIKGWVRTTHNANEHFRVGMGTAVSALYGGGAFGMLFAWLKGDDELFDKSAKVYSTGMFNQNQIFGSMNAAIVLKRFLFRDKSQPDMNNTHLPEVDRYSGDLKANVEVVDTALFIPNIITRGLDTLKLFGIELGKGTQRAINFLNYLGYGNWAFRFGDVKRRQEGGGDLEPINKNLKGMAGTIDKTLHDVQKHSSVVFRWLLSGVSWTSCALELLGKPELAEKVFKWEGILERLHPTVAAWCIRNPVLNLFKRDKQAIQNNQQATQVVKLVQGGKLNPGEKPKEKIVAIIGKDGERKLVKSTPIYTSSWSLVSSNAFRYASNETGRTTDRNGNLLEKSERQLGVIEEGDTKIEVGMDNWSKLWVSHYQAGNLVSQSYLRPQTNELELHFRADGGMANDVDGIAARITSSGEAVIIYDFQGEKAKTIRRGNAEYDEIASMLREHLKAIDMVAPEDWESEPKYEWWNGTALAPGDPERIERFARGSRNIALAVGT